MLKSKKYIGVYTYGDIEVPDGIPRIISDELFYIATDVLVKNKKHAGWSKAKAEYLLTTKLFCGHCKSLMVGVSGHSSTRKAYNYYSCNNTRLKSKKCNKKLESKDLIEDLVIKKCLEILTDKNIEKISD